MCVCFNTKDSIAKKKRDILKLHDTNKQISFELTETLNNYRETGKKSRQNIAYSWVIENVQ